MYTLVLLCYSDSGTRSQGVLVSASKLLRDKYGFAHTTLQVEEYQQEMDYCGPCQGTRDSRPRDLSPVW